MTRLNIGLITTETEDPSGLGAAVRENEDVIVHRFEIGEQAEGRLDGIVVDVPIEQRCEAVTSVALNSTVPILLEMPAAGSAGELQSMLARMGTAPLFSLNPLDYHYPTRRLREEIVDANDPIETVFAAWRFQSTIPWEHRLPQLIDFIGRLCGASPIRITSISREVPKILLGLLRYDNDVIGNVEIGGHLPNTATMTSDLLIECFCKDSVYQCNPGNQAISISGRHHERIDWASNPASQIISTFVDQLRGHTVHLRTAHADSEILTLSERFQAAPGKTETFNT